MRKIDVGKSGWIRSAKVDFVREGTMKGLLHVEVEMSGETERGSFDDVAALVTRLIETRLPTKRVVRFTGALPDDDPNFVLLVKALFDYRFDLQCVIDDRRVHVWDQWMSWVIVRATEPIVMTASDELWFTPETLPQDVTIPIRPNRVTFCHVGGRLDVADVDEFMCRSKHSWTLL